MAPMLAPSLRASSLYGGTPTIVPRPRVARVRSVRRTPAPVQALFGFGNRPSQSSPSQRVAELEDELLSTVRGSTAGGLSADKQEKLDELLEEAGSLQGKNALKDFEGTFKFVYNSRRIGAPIAKFNFVKISYEDGMLGVESSFGLFGILPGSAKRRGPITMKGPNKFTVTWEEAAFNAPFIDPPPETGVGGVWVYNILYSGPSICILTAQIEKNVGKTEPVLSICERIPESGGDQSPSTAVGAGRQRVSGLATKAERKYEQQVSASSDEKPVKKPAGLFGGFFAPPRYPDAEEEAPVESAKQDSRKIKARAQAMKEDPAQAKRTAEAKAKAAAAAKAKAEAEKKAAAEAKAKAAAAAKAEAEKKAAAEAKAKAAAAAKAEAEKKAAAEAKAKAAAAAKAKAEAERAAAQKKKEEISAFLNQLADDLKAAQQETRASSDTLRNASKENAAAVKEAQAAQKKIDAAEASVKVVEDEIEELSAQEQEIGEQLRDAQRELQKLRA